MPSPPLLEVLASARQIATHAESMGIVIHATPVRPTIDHIGAALADCILQAGLNYRTVVRPRVERIRSGYDDLQAVVSCAADLLGMPRRDFDAWIWKLQARQSSKLQQQLALF